MILARFVTSFLLLVSIFFLPYWFYLAALFVAIFFWPFFLEALVLVSLIEILYGTGEGIFSLMTQPPVWIVFFAILLMVPIRERLRTHA